MRFFKHFYLLITLFFCFLLIPTEKVHAANLDVVMIGDTMANGIAEGVEKDLRNMQAEVQEISHYTGLELKTVMITGQDVRQDKIRSELANLKVNSDDVVLFFYSGHGSHENKDPNNPWPYLLLSRDKSTIDLETINSILMSKHPRFLLSVANACNSLEAPKDSPGDFKMDAQIDYTWLVNHDWKAENNYRKLFLETNGTILVTSSKVGEPSYGKPSYGGYYPYAFVVSLQQEVQYFNHPSWGSILKKSYDFVSSKQHPDYLMLNVS